LTKLGADLPQVKADRVQLQQVVMNLFINGIEAMRNTDRTRELAIELLRSETGKVLVSVGDAGVGIPSQQMYQIFNAFCTIKAHRTGIGLRISGTIFRSHGDRLWAAQIRRAAHFISRCSRNSNRTSRYKRIEGLGWGCRRALELHENRRIKEAFDRSKPRRDLRAAEAANRSEGRAA
jgi:signal transduction histidine kinase